MAYRFTLNESIPEAVRRIAHEQLGKACDHLDHAHSAEIDEAVHDVRTRCKKLRGLIRLVRPAMKNAEYQKANAAFRDAARQLSPIRDAHALSSIFDDLVAAHADQVPTDGVSRIREGLSARTQSASPAASDRETQVARARDLLRGMRSQVDRWTLDEDFEPVRAGLAKTYRRGRKRFADSLEQPSDEHLHEWRKRVKYSWYHMRLLRDSAPSVLKPLANRLHDLSDVLGDDHNLAVLTGQLCSSRDEFGGAGEANEALIILDGRRADLQRRALRLGGSLYVERPSAFGRRMTGYWRVWQEHGEELAAGEIAELAPPDDGLDGLSRDELYQRAQQFELAGRSSLGSMDRAELVAVIRAAGGGRG
ncbi:MAG: CHAD domain-containing protein [Egibacteraceae bacterium]